MRSQQNVENLVMHSCKAANDRIKISVDDINRERRYD